jgi:hypothetical protein
VRPILVPISPGELLDKVSDVAKVANVKHDA